nr:family 43 glycosylhydrolase [Streptomyces himalayensis]
MPLWRVSWSHPQKAGHGSLVDVGDGEWYLAYLVARPHGRQGPCVLGREIALAPVAWTADGWPRTPTGLPALEVPAPDTTSETEDTPSWTGPADGDDVDGFDQPALGPSGRRCAGPRYPTGSPSPNGRPTSGFGAAGRRRAW